MFKLCNLTCSVLFVKCMFWYLLYGRCMLGRKVISTLSVLLSLYVGQWPFLVLNEKCEVL